MNEIKLDDAWCVWLEFSADKEENIESDFYELSNSFRSYQSPHSQINPTQNIHEKL